MYKRQDLYLASKRYLNESGFEILWETKDLKAEPGAVDIPTEHEILFSQQGIPIKAVIARWNCPKKELGTEQNQNAIPVKE